MRRWASAVLMLGQPNIKTALDQRRECAGFLFSRRELLHVTNYRATSKY